MATKLIGSIDLLKLKNAFVKKQTTKSGQKIDCLLIPLDMNGLSVYTSESGNSNLNISIMVEILDETDKFNNNARIKKLAPKRTDGRKWEDLTEAEKTAQNELTPFIGSLKYLERSQQPTNNYALQAPQMPQVVNSDADDDSLPF